MDQYYEIRRETVKEPLGILRQINQDSIWEGNPYYAVIYMSAGTCQCETPLATYPVKAPALLFFTPFQQYRFSSEGSYSGDMLNFHADFYCIEKHKREVACNGILFNNIYTPPYVLLDAEQAETTQNYLGLLWQDMKREEDVTREDMVIAHLKIILIIATRLKSKQMQEATDSLSETTRPKLQELHHLIESHFTKWHKPADYAAALNISVKTLSKLTCKHLSKTPSRLIAERIVQEARRALHFSNLSIKEIADQTGFEDPFYFSRLFRKYTGVSPREFRQRVGVIIMA